MSAVIETIVPTQQSPIQRARAPSEFPDSPLSQAFKQPLMLGLFLNLQDIQRTALPTSNTWTFDYNTRIVQQGEALGFELAFSRTQWLPKGGYDGEASLDSFIALGAMAAATSRIMLISTMHVLYGPLHPLHIAKYGATLDHIAKGRWGINIVTGHRAIEHEMFGWQRIEHDQRYALSAELFDVVESLWSSDEDFWHRGRQGWAVNRGFITPKPLYGRPVLVNATGSDAGIDFAARYSDIIFVTSPGGSGIDAALATLPDHTAQIRAAAGKAGRTVRTLINPVIVSRDTEAETEAYADAIVAGKTGVQPGNRQYDSDAHAWRGRKDGTRNVGRGLGGNIEIVGTPEQVVEQLIALKAAGIDGIQIGFFDFEKDLAHFGASILPLLKSAGLRL
ncbi:LLM class flavin-dependent oxidoreductase [Paucibacter sp. R3-3]|uniref:LLM class flavin-dependent oxidoreductase n=1 Tax=Roseateles agri TaxID=3098619 RepID=A0ABU5DMX2_9BURK|nr:LLM class flavin-dependent oxidoreductase [Paucibacter sp. R3-3]MDY0747670.1 LLM class flavin-dependent oxidoreductase [Paucibacter sp. R3-3]